MKFIFENYEFDRENFVAKFHYGLGEYEFTEEVRFAKNDNNYDEKLLNSALFLAHILIGTSYYKTFPTRDVEIRSGAIDAWQAEFFDRAYQEGLSQFAYENDLTRENLAHFRGAILNFAKSGANEKSAAANRDIRETARNYFGEGILALQSGGKDSLLVAEMLREKRDEFDVLYLSSAAQNYPRVLDELSAKNVRVATRTIDRENLATAAANGARNGHVPITFIVAALATIQAILLNKNQILTGVAHEGEEPREMIGDLPVNHQWAKMWAAETAFQDYVAKYISPDIRVGSPLRQYSELAVAELFAQKCWRKFGRKFSSCNVGNYKQGAQNSALKWCGECAKCANSWLLFSPFVAEKELAATFGVEQDLFANPQLAETFRGLLGVDGAPKPFECVGEFAELRKAYALAMKRGDYAPLPFAVPKSEFNYREKYEHNGDLVI